VKCISSCFEKLSGTRIDFHGSEVIAMNLGPDQVVIAIRDLIIAMSLPMKYLCVPLHFSKLKREETTSS